MLHPRPAKTRVRKSVSAALTALLVLAFLPAAPPASRVAAQTAGDDTQNPNIPAVPPGQAYRQTNLISDVPGLAPIQDPLLVNPWGVTATSSSPFWVVNNGTGTTQLLRGDVVGSPFVLNPSPQTVTLPGGPPSLPTGAVAVSNVTTAATDFNFTPTGGSTPVKAVFIFDSITGNIIAWNPALGATAQVVKSQPGHTYTGLAIGNSGGNPFLYAADFANGKIDVFDKTFTPTTLAGTFTDPTIPATFHPFNIQNLGGTLFVSYAKVGTGGNVVTNGPGNGFVSKFNTDGTFIGRFVSNGALDAPWGMVIAPASFGIFGGAVLVGNFSDNGIITAYNSGGTFLGTLQNEAGQPIVNDQLWALTFGNGGAGGDPNTLYFSAGIADEEHGLFGKLNPTTATATSLVQFASDTFTIGEGSGHIDITIFRAGDASGTATVNVNTFDSSQAGHASQKSDYEIALQKVTFAPGDTSKTVRILIVNDNFVEGDETVNLALSNPTGVGVGLGSPNQATLTITDNDSSPSSTNPVDDPSFFVRQHYLDFLNREPDTAGFNFWVNNITSCGSDAQCIEVKRINTSAAFFLSIEFQQTGLLAYLANKAAFGNSPLANAAVPVLYGQFERDTQALQRNFVFGAPGADAQLEANKQAYFTDFVARPDFVAAFPTTQTPAQFVDALFANAGVTPSTSDRNAAIAEFGAATNTTDQAARARALRDVAQNTAFSQAEFNRAFVTMEYFGYLRRDPDAAGFNFWLNKLNAFNGNFVNAEMVKAFLSSSEYRQRFGAS